MGGMKSIVRERERADMPTRCLASLRANGMDHRRRKIVPCIDEGYIGWNSVMHS